MYPILPSNLDDFATIEAQDYSKEDSNYISQCFIHACQLLAKEDFAGAERIFRKLIVSIGKDDKQVAEAKTIEYECNMNIAVCRFKQGEAREALKILTILMRDQRVENERVRNC